ncbi:hypothetical protein N9N28_10795 [Rubripirellula amarantea]|uniref:Uncharacterized protein n=1 Tax=Rubripirellula amarantea TaxID=2527999 RepID=A0A5C5WQ96_9BACT|nr:hypothetical protein [Rubripirellula amarantea]MDA8745109.1 hypothetical protein [Rubripirellula amarantea]TWT52956.1 hypothetical protein Pla22_05840 [Rubripirellula amarantea]
MTSKIQVCLLLVVSLFTSSMGYAQDEKLPLLLKRSPAPANAIGYVNVGALNKLMSDAEFADRVSDNVGEFWFISDLNLTDLRPRWEAGYATLENGIDANELATSVGGYVDQIAGQDVVWSPQEMYLYPAKENRLGVLRPADRSLVSGWLSSDMPVNYSSFLDKWAAQKESFLSMMLAIEVKNVFSPVPMAKRLETFKSIKSKSPESVASTLASANGISIIVGRRSLNECIVSVEFTKSPASLENIAAELFAEMLERGGSAAPEVLTWKAKVDGNTLSLQGPITESTLSGLLGIFSLEDQASRTIALSSDGGSQGKTEAEKMGFYSKHYFDEVNAIIERTRDHKSQTTGALAKWNDQRARKIDELGTLNVDPEMIQYGTNVAEALRGNALTVTQGNIAAGKTKAAQGLNNGYYGNGSYYNANSTADYHAVTNAYARGNAYANFKDTLNQIDQLTAQVRRTMTEKYQLQF